MCRLAGHVMLLVQTSQGHLLSVLLVCPCSCMPSSSAKKRLNFLRLGTKMA